jgi:mannose-6-phosphate isomerase-like protein (cupin superfamily)
MAIRRVVTGHDAAGQAVFASDTVVDAITVDLLPGFEFVRLWGADTPPAFPDDGAQPAAPAYFPPVGGFRFGTFTVPPATQVDPSTVDIDAALAALEAALPGMAAHMEPDAPGMHTTASVDYEYVVSGRVVLELDNGASVELGPGDTVIQNGTRHAWRNPFDEPCVMVVVLVGVPHRHVNH